MKSRILNPLKRASVMAASLMLFACGDCGGSANNMNNTPDMTPECTEGQVDCSCDAQGACADGAVCSGGMCVGATTSGLTLSAAGARSCEVLLTEGASRVLGASYAEGVEGAWRKRAPRIAIAISQTADADMPASAISLQLQGEASGVTVSSVSCFDAQGGAIDGASAALD